MNDKWMTLEEAIAHVMKVRGVSRGKARRMLVAEAKKNRLKIRNAPKPSPLKYLEPEVAAERFAEDPASVVLTLSDLLVQCNFSPDELMGELRSGRLRAFALSQDAIFNAELTGRSDPASFAIDGKAAAAWLANPQTPPHLAAKFLRGRGPTQ